VPGLKATKATPSLLAVLLARALVVTSGAQDTLILDGANHAVLTAPLRLCSPPPAVPIALFASDLSRLSADSTTPRPFALVGWVDLGSEIGEPLFARITDKTGGNREHITNAGAVISRHGASLLGTYRHSGNYSDRYDDFWARYKEHHGKRSPYDALGDNGLANYYLAAWRLDGTAAWTEGYAARYEHWSTTPYFFSPLFRQGVRLEQTCRFAFGAYAFAGRLGVDTENRYPNHHTPIDYSHLWADYGIERGLGDAFVSGIRLRLASDETPGVAVAAHLGDTAIEPLGWSIRAGTFEDGSVFGTAGIQLGRARQLSFSLGGALDHVPARRSYRFHTVHDTVAYSYESYQTLRLTSTLSWPGTVGLPLSIELWADHDHRPAREWVDTSGSPKAIVHRPASQPISRVGVKTRYRYRLGPLSVTPWARGHLVAGRQPEPLAVPWSAGVEVGVGSMSGSLPGATLRVEAVGPVSVAYRQEPDGEFERHSVSERVQLSGECRVPFVLPSWAGMLSPLFRVRVSPIHLTGTTRQKHHPFGSVLGPVILCTLEGRVVGR
jgi:hypothetical protein